MEAHLEGRKRESGDSYYTHLLQEFLPWSTVEKLSGTRGDCGEMGGLCIYVVKLEYIRERL